MDDKKEFFRSILNIENTNISDEKKQKTLEKARIKAFRQIANNFGYNIWLSDGKMMIVGPDRAQVRDLARAAREECGGYYSTAKIVSSDESTAF